jgi:hypothetical protein
MSTGTQTTNSTNNRSCSGHPRVTTPRQDSYIFLQHMNNRFTRALQASRQTIDSHQRPISDVYMLEYDSLEKTQTINIQTESVVRNIFKIWHHMGSLNLVAQITKSVICNTNVEYRRRASRILFIMYAHNPKIGKSNNRVGKPKCINRIFQISQGYQCSYLTFKWTNYYNIVKK